MIVGICVMNSVLGNEEVEYQSRVTVYVNYSGSMGRDNTSAVSLEHFNLDIQFGPHWYIGHHQHLYPGRDIETRYCCEEVVGGVLVGWYDMDI